MTTEHVTGEVDVIINNNSSSNDANSSAGSNNTSLTPEQEQAIKDLTAWFRNHLNETREFFDKLSAILNVQIIPKPPIVVDPNPPNPNPDPKPDNGGGNGNGGDVVGPDGVLQLYPIKKDAKAKPFYINLDNPDENNKVFATTYGSDIVKFAKKQKDGNVEFVRNVGHKQTYASGNEPGKSCRFHISAGGNMSKPGKYSWKDKTIPQYVTASDVCYYSHELTIIARPGKALGTHQSFAAKLNSRPDQPDDNLRSTIEGCMNNDQKKVPYVNYNYAHKGYESVTGVKQFTSDGKITVGQWIGVKWAYIIADDRKSTLMRLFVNTHPIDLTTGKPDNGGWKLKAEYVAKGIKDYNNIPPVWGGDSYFRIDGYDYIDVFRISQYEIEKTPISPTKLMSLSEYRKGVEIPSPVEGEDQAQWESENEYLDEDNSSEYVVKAIPNIEL